MTASHCKLWLWMLVSFIGSGTLVWSVRMTWLSMLDHRIFVLFFSPENMIDWTMYGMRDALVFSAILYTQGALLYYFDALPRVCHIYFRCAAVLGIMLVIPIVALLSGDAVYRAWRMWLWLVTAASTRYTLVGDPY